ncbi:hypothetical protein CEXT_631881 [Caerostris extrusa]|uniref:Secreted protein n=1 Tax=Caerostris extrusa TaxID=172846 RepID=A0AAV4T6S3_CAEEX|nr:hypothetical protein CEXT_631881 [Caerostris extrusa]
MFTTRSVWFLYFLPSARPINIIDVFLPGAPSTGSTLPSTPWIPLAHTLHRCSCAMEFIRKDPIFSSPIPFHYSDLIFRKFESPRPKSMTSKCLLE